MKIKIKKDTTNLAVSACGIYAIVNTYNNKVYIGQTNNFKRREAQHKYLLRSNKHGMTYKNKKNTMKIDHLQKAWNKYGERSFKWKILEYCEETKLAEREQFYMNKYKSYNRLFGYNLSTKSDRIGFTEEIRLKMRNSATGNKNCLGKKNCLGRKRSDEEKKNISKSLLGRKLSEDHKEKLSKAQTGRKFSEDHKEKIRIGNTGKKMSEEAKRKVSEAQKGRKRTEEEKEKHRKIHLGRKFSEEHKEKIRCALKGKKNSLGYKHSEEAKRKIGLASSLRRIKINEN